jgi:hypothetical protein
LLSIIIPASIEVISDCCFQECGKLAAVTFDPENKLKRIMKYAFNNTFITKFILPDNVVLLDKFCFSHCTHLKQFVISENSLLHTIEEQVFSSSNLQSLTLSKRIEHIKGSNLLTLKSLEISPDNPTFIIEGSCVMTRDHLQIVACLGVLETLEIPQKIQRIGPFVFPRCEFLTNITFTQQSNLFQIDEFAFYGSNIQSIVLPSSVEILNKSCFANCRFLKAFEIDPAGQLKQIESKVFKNSGLRTILLPRKLAVLAGSAIQTLTSVGIARGAQVFAFDGSCVFNVSTMTLIRSFSEDPIVSFCDLYSCLGPSSFAGCCKLQRVHFGETSRIRQFDTACFARSQIESINIPKTVEIIKSRAFYNCKQLREVIIDLDSHLKRIESQAFAFSSLKTLCIPPKVQFIDGSAIQSLESLTAPASIFKFSKPFLIDSMRNILVRYFGQDSVTIPIQIEIIGPGCFEKSPLKSVSLSRDSLIKVIDQRAFAQTQITIIIIPNSVSVIGKSAFQDCHLLQTVEFGDFSRLYRIEEFAFSGTALFQITLPSSITFIGSGAFHWSCEVEMLKPSQQFIDWRSAIFDNPFAPLISDVDDRLADLSAFLINIDDYNKLHFLGSGGSADVTLYQNKFTLVQVAIKTLHPGIIDSDRFHTLFLREVMLLHELVHPCICKLHGIALPTETNPGLIATEFVAGGSLRSILDDPPRWFNATSRVIVLVGIVVAMIFVHTKGVMHRDLKPANVLLDDHGRPKICDFGTGKFNDGSLNTANFGTVLYMAPEMYDDGSLYTDKVDVYAFAMILYEVIVGKPAFEKPNNGAFWAHVLHIKRGGRRTIPPEVKVKTGRLIEACWAQSAEDRPSFSEVFEAMAEMNFVLLDGVHVEEVYRFFEWTAGRNV